MKKKKVVALIMSALLTCSATSFAATYSVEDTVARQKLEDIRAQLEIVLKYLDLLKEKNVSMDVMDKAAAERKNDSMRKLSLASNSTIAKSIVSEGNNGVDYSDVLGPIVAQTIPHGNTIGIQEAIKVISGSGKGNFTQVLGGFLNKETQGIFGHINNKKAMRLPLDEYAKQIEQRTSYDSYKSLTTESACRTYCKQVDDELVEDYVDYVKEYTEASAETKKFKDKTPGLLSDITKAKADTDTNSNNLWSQIGTFGSLLGNKGVFDGQTFNVGGKSIKLDYGSFLDPTNITRLMNKEGTGSITGAEEKTTSVELVATSEKQVDMKLDDLAEETSARLGVIETGRVRNKDNCKVRIAEITKDRLRNLPVREKGVKPVLMFEGKYGSMFN